MTQQKIITTTTDSGLYYRSGMTSAWHLYCHSSILCPRQTLLINHGILSKPRNNLRIFYRAPYQSATINQFGARDKGYIQSLIKIIYWAMWPKKMFLTCIPFSNNNLAFIHGQKSLCWTFGIEVGDCETLVQPQEWGELFEMASSHPAG